MNHSSGDTPDDRQTEAAPKLRDPVARARKLHRTILVAVVVGVVLVSLVSGLLVFYSLYLPYKRAELGRLEEFQLTRAFALDEYARRAEAVALQISRRTRARALLSAYLAKAMPREQYAEETRRILADALQGDTELVGVVRTTVDGEVLASAGRSIPQELWPAPPGPSDAPTKSGPHPVDGSCATSVRSAILREAEVIGYDVVLLSCGSLLAGVATSTSLAQSAETFWAWEGAGGWQIFTITAAHVTEAKGRGASRAAELLAHADGPREVTPDGEFLAAASRVRGTPWAVAVTVEADEFYAQVQQRGWWSAAFLLSVVALGALGVAFVLRPLERGALLLTSELDRELTQRDEFLAIASHELRTPIATLRVVLDALRVDGVASAEDKVNKRIDLASRQTHRLTRLIEELLTASLIQEGKLRLTSSEIDLAAVARGVAEELSEDLARAGCTLTFDAPHAVLGTWDSLRLGQVAMNLLVNAIKFGEGKPIGMQVGREGEVAVLRIRDQGIGIAPALRPFLFKRFERGVSARHYGGMGIGLYVVNAIVSAHGGTVSVESPPGGGSVFEVRLPAPTHSVAAAPS